jgi:NADH-quinone oxidoreductase subunit C
MNSMNNNVADLVKDVETKFDVKNVDHPKQGQVAFDFDPRDIHTVLSYLKSKGWAQLSILSCVDWIDDNEFQLVYIIFNWELGIRIQVRTRIDREEAKFDTIINIYPGAKYYERDVHEFFGVVFAGNPDSNKQLFLENWDDMPPLRKDFDSIAYSDKKYPKREYKTDFSKKAGDK